MYLNKQYIIQNLGQKVLDGHQLDCDQVLSLLQAEGADTFDLLSWSNRIRQHFKGNRIHLCSIVNAKSGGCSEDCTFCAQSIHYETASPVYKFLDQKTVVEASQTAESNKVQALGLVAAWRGLGEGRMLDQVCQRIEDLSQSGRVRADASLGLIESQNVAQRLKEAGLSVYNHNLETASSFFDQICTTHTHQDRINTIQHCKSAGLRVCSGGIFGMGETVEQRAELAIELQELDVDVVPLNFLVRIEGTPLTDNDPLSPMEILTTIAAFRFALPQKEIMVAGGREANLRDMQSMIFMAGASATLVGNYLTTGGRSVEDDLQMLSDLGLEWDWNYDW